MSIVRKLKANDLIHPPRKFVADTCYEVITGSFAYGVSGDTSDMDVFGVCVPDQDVIFPHLLGHIPGFGPEPYSFDVYQKHHIEDSKKEYDVCVMSIIKFFNLAAENNPNIIDILFVPERCIIHSDDIGNHIRGNRRLFLSKRCFVKMKGYAFSELKAIDKSIKSENEYNFKSAYHVVRLLNQAEQIMLEGDLDLERSKEQLKAIRRGEWSITELKRWFYEKELYLTSINATNNSLGLQADYQKIKAVLMECLEMKFGDLTKMQVGSTQFKLQNQLDRIKNILDSNE